MIAPVGTLNNAYKVRQSDRPSMKQDIHPCHNCPTATIHHDGTVLPTEPTEIPSHFQ